MATATTSANSLNKGAGATGHDLFVKLAGEAVGIFILAVFADMNDDIGGVFVTIMAGWFIVFLGIHATDLSALASKV